MDEVARYVGYGVMVLASVLPMGYLLIKVVETLNNLQRKIVSHFYGWKYFLEFRDWYWKNKDEEAKK
jgi:hypothetical protein